jgi:hypothetical protein
MSGTPRLPRDPCCHTLNLSSCARSVSVSIQDAESLFLVVDVRHTVGRQANGVASHRTVYAAARCSGSERSCSRVSRCVVSVDATDAQASRPSVTTSCPSPKAAPTHQATFSRSARRAQTGRPQPSHCAGANVRGCDQVGGICSLGRTAPETTRLLPQNVREIQIALRVQ